MASDLGVLFRKEARQLVKSRAALWTSITLPFFLVVVAPLTEFLSVSNRHSIWMSRFAMNVPLPGLRDGMQSQLALVKWVFPLLVSLGGLLVPAITAVHTIISERESRTLELLAALPVSIGHVLFAKLGTILVFSALVSALLIGIDAAVLLPRGVVSPGYLFAVFLLSVSSMGYSATASLLTTLVSRDFRTANNVNGMLLAPLIFVATSVLALVPGAIARIAVLSLIFVVVGAAALLVAVRVVSFERLLR